METTDTMELLKECSAGCKMAISAIDEVEKTVSDRNLLKLLVMSKSRHQELESKTNMLLKRDGEEDKSPNPVAKAMSWMKINGGIMMNSSDEEIANLMTDGCNMGIKSMHQYKNKFAAADASAKKMADDIISCEKDLLLSLEKYL